MKEQKLREMISQALVAEPRNYKLLKKLNYILREVYSSEKKEEL